MSGVQAIGGYRLMRLLGRGTTGSVFLARDPASDSDVALKTLRWLAGAAQGPELELRLRFDREVTIAARLSHPGIVTVLASGHEPGLAWIAMEYVAGANLTRYCSLARLLPSDLVVEVLAAILDALGHAHRQGVLHRDLKPANILIDLSRRVVKLADFGVGWLDDAARTRTGVSLGSPAYMAPELLAGAEPQPRADLYSVGVLAYEMLTGRLPYQGTSMGALLRASVGAEAADVRDHQPSVAPELAGWVAALMHRSAASRPANAELALEALHQARGSAKGSVKSPTLAGLSARRQPT